MKYLSTRGGDERLSFEEAVLKGLAPNGGLYIPESIPTLPADWQEAWKDLSFVDLALEIYSHFIDEADIPREDLRTLIAKSYSTFRHEKVAPLVQTKEHQHILELFHGPTYAFKDVALQFVGNVFEYFLEKRKGFITVVGATSGDTGSAAIYGLRSKKDVSIFILHPKGRVSPIQEAQMTTVPDENVFNLAVEGTFDDCQNTLKELFNDTDFNNTYHLGAVNSINWARILAQTVYYFSAFFELRRTDARPIQFVVPTGNFGDVLAGYYAMRLGLPTQKLVVATNANDILTRFWATGRYEKRGADAAAATDDAAKDAGATEAADIVTDGAQAAEAPASDDSGVAQTLSPAMDILVSSNFERLLFYLALEETDADADTATATAAAQSLVNSWMSDLKTKGSLVVGPKAFAAATRDISAGRASDAETTETIKAYYSKKELGSYIPDPHTAVALTVANRIASDDVTQVVLSTAHPAKFGDAVNDALKEFSDSFNFDRDVLPAELAALADKPRRVIDVKNDIEQIKAVIAEKVAELASKKRPAEESVEKDDVKKVAV